MVVELIESSVMEGFYHIAGYSNYVINEKGEVYNLSSNTFLTGATNPVGYVNFRLTDDNGITLTWGRHRLMAFVFKHPGCDIKELVVNHENGIKGDDWLDNLTWTTHKGNIEHAGLNRLTEKCKPISVRDVLTGEVKDYPSIIECARDLGVSKDNIAYRVAIGEKRIFPEMKQYRLKHVSSSWHVPEDISLELKRNTTSKSVLMRYVETNEVIEFSKIRELSEFINVPVSTLSVWLSKKDQPVLPGLIQLKYSTDTTPWRYVVDVYSEAELFSKKKAVKVINDRNGAMAIFETAKECGDFMDVKPSTLNARLQSNGQKVFDDGYRYCYYSIDI